MTDYMPGPEKMKPKCDMKVKKSKSEVMLAAWASSKLKNTLSYGLMVKDKKNEAGFVFSEQGLYKLVSKQNM